MRVGIDMIEIERVRAALTKRRRFADRVFTEEERRYCFSRPNPAQHFAARFAGKEAVGKAIGCGVEFMWRDIEIAGRPKPSVTLSGKVAELAERFGAGDIDLSMTHSKGMAAAVAIVQPRGKRGPPDQPFLEVYSRMTAVSRCPRCAGTAYGEETRWADGSKP